jgi:hypothetical protein
MSVISNRHTVVPFVAGKTQAFENQRLAKVGYKTTKKSKAKYPNIAVSVPKIQDSDIVENVDSLIPYIRPFLELAQNGIIRSLYESADGVLKEIGDDDISVSACIQYLEAESTGGRLTKEMIAEWFDENLSDNLFVTVAEKLKFDTDNGPNEEQTAVINKHVKVYKEVLSMLAGGKTLLQPAQIKGCKVALGLDTTDSEIGKKLMNRLVSMEKPKMTAEMLELD